MGTSFEWNAQKCAANIVKHGIDFDDAIEIFDELRFEYPSSKHEEARYVAVGEMQGIAIAVVYTLRGEVRRIISARRARPNEERDYYKAIGRKPP